MASQYSEDVQENLHRLLSASNGRVPINQCRVQGIYCGRIRRIRVRSVLLILLWTLAVSASSSVFGYLAFDFKYLNKLHASGILSIALIAFSGPLAGWLADIKLGRYRVLHASLWSMWIGITVLVLVDSYVSDGMARKVLKPLCGVPICCGFSGFMANAIQFAIDQMPEASSNEVSAFNHWFVWMIYCGRALSNTLIQLSSCSELLVGRIGNTFILLFMLGLLTLGLGVGVLFRKTLTVMPESRNPMKTVIHVLRYSATHKYPENRRAHTYTDSCIPSRLDLGKEIYGGPFTTEQVEDVKTFLRIISIILTTVAVVISLTLCWRPRIIDHFQSFSNESHCIRVVSGLIYSEEVIVIFGILLYELFIYPLARRWIPTILNKIVIAAVLNIFMCLFLLIFTSAGHYMHDSSCILFTSTQEHADNMAIPINYLAIDIPFHLLKAVIEMLYWIALFEFICAQSPYNMKGFLLGMGSFAIYFGEGIAVFIQVWWYYRWADEKTITSPSCDFWYYLMVTIIAVLALVLVVLVVRCYQQREREEPIYDRMHVENYYEKYSSFFSFENVLV